MRRFQVRVVPQLQAMEAKVVLSTLAMPAAASQAAAAERVAATPLVSDRNTIKLLNKTSYAISVEVVFKPERGSPLTRKVEIRPNGSLPVGFDSREKGNMTASIRRTDNRTPPAPYLNAPLSRNIDGYYDGKEFRIATNGSYYLVSPP